MTGRMLNAALLDSNVVIDLTGPSSEGSAWSETAVAELRASGQIYINPIVYAEVSVGFPSIEYFEADLHRLRIQFDRLPRAALFLAGRQYQKYRRENQGPKTSLLPDFLIGAHATVLDIPLVTRDVRRYRTYFPRLTLISPDVV